MRSTIWKLMTLLALMFALGIISVGCGSSANDGEAGGAVAGCLSPGEVQEEVNRIAEGAESSSEEVEAKQEEIQAIEAEGC